MDAGSRGATPPAATQRRSDIEGLRFIAALLVACYHLWFGRVSGGVDVFFTVSGFLITLTLLGHLRDHGRPRPLRFVGRLLRRLLPAAVTVLLAVVVVRTFIFPPLVPSVPEIVASALFYENWQLAFSSVDYLASDDRHTVVQHFWAISVQGQVTLIWLALFAVVWIVTAVAGRTRWGHRPVLLAFLVGSFALSLTLSVIVTAEDQAFAYFNTFARVWEFALGGIVAVVLPRLAISSVVRRILGWFGLAAIVLCGVIFDLSTAFPGFAALMPTLGAALVLVAGAGVNAAPNPVLSWRPMAWLGGLAYGIYLWHWPLLLFARDALHFERVGLIGGLLIISGAIVLAWLTRVLVERPMFRLTAPPAELKGGTSDAAVVRRSTTIATAIPIVVIFAIVGSSLTVSAQAARADAGYRALIELALTQPTTGDTRYCLGAAARDPAGCVPLPAELDHIIPLAPLQDKAVVYEDGCATLGTDTAHLCPYGDRGGDVSILLIGNSHTASWFPAFSALADKNGWRLDVFFRPQCVFNPAPKKYGDDQTQCSKFYAEVTDQLTQLPPYDLVVSTYRTDGQFWSNADGERDDSIAVEGFRAAWAPLIARGSTIVVMRGVPHIGEDQLLCQEQGQKFGHDDCASPRSEAVDPDLMVLATRDYPGSVVIDMNDWFCTSTLCPATVGNVKVYQDTSSHLTSTFILTTAPYLEIELDKVLAARG